MENATDVVNPDTSAQTAPLHSSSPTSTTEVGATDGGAEAGAEDALIRQDAGGMLLILEHPVVDPNFPSATCPANGIMRKMNGATKKMTTMDMKKDTNTMNTRGRETIPGEGIEQEPSPVHANLLQPPNLDAVPRRQETYGEHFSGWKDSEGTAGHWISSLPM